MTTTTLRSAIEALEADQRRLHATKPPRWEERHRENARRLQELRSAAKDQHHYAVSNHLP